jgi:hypothetical protein
METIKIITGLALISLINGCAITPKELTIRLIYKEKIMEEHHTEFEIINDVINLNKDTKLRTMLLYEYNKLKFTYKGEDFIDYYVENVGKNYQLSIPEEDKEMYKELIKNRLNEK